jgi:hypothetical protein
MRRRLRAVAAGLLVVGACTIAGTAAAADGAGPVATPPSTPRTQTVSGVATNGVQLAVTAPAQLPLDLPGQPLPEREVDVTVKDVGGQGYSGQVSMTLAPEGGGASAASLRVDHFDLASGAWKSVPGDSSFTVADSVTVPASGTQVLKLRLSPGTAAVSDVKLDVTANGATAVATMPVSGLSFQVSGLSGSGRAGSPMLLTGTLSNPTDVGLQNIPVKLLLCSGGATGSAGSAGCVARASDVKVEVQNGSGAWHTVQVSGATASSPMSATVVPQLTLPAGGSAQISVRVTVGAGAFGAPGQPAGQPSTPASAQPISVAVALSPVGLSFDGQPTMSGTLTVQPPLPTPATPSSTPSTSATADPTPTDSSTATGDPTATPTGATTPGAAPSTEGASMPAASASSSNPTILVAAGLLAVCLALVLWWVLMKRRERMARVAVAHAGDDEDLHDDQQ